MRTKAFAGAALAVLAAGAIATPTLAQGYYGYDNGYCQAQRHDNGAAGAVVGGVLGALLGSSVAPHHANRAGGAAIGAVAGALIGNSVARSGSSCDQGYGYAQPQVAYAQPYASYDYGYAEPYVASYDYGYASRGYDRDRYASRRDDQRGYRSDDRR
jgi:Glycine zipper 2TM domain